MFDRNFCPPVGLRVYAWPDRIEIIASGRSSVPYVVANFLLWFDALDPRDCLIDFGIGEPSEDAFNETIDMIVLKVADTPEAVIDKVVTEWLEQQFAEKIDGRFFFRVKDKKVTKKDRSVYQIV
jgi:tRNA A-37 threonylcarbamoyl transferase component Bud32